MELAPSRQLDGRRQPPTDRRARGADEALWPGSGRKPLEGESRTWLRGETNPQSREEEQTAEGVRNAEGGP
jgi:hypothetical protein